MVPLQKKKNKPGDFDFLTFSVPVMKQTISMCFLLWRGGGAGVMRIDEPSVNN